MRKMTRAWLIPFFACVWGVPVEIGKLDSSLLDEESGLAVSSRYSGRLYHVNDSGGGPYFFMTDMAGGSTQKIRIEDFQPTDMEDLALGSCLNGKACLFLGDIGDNMASREKVTVVLVEEMEKFSDPSLPAAKIYLKYPDGAHDAEAMALHPNGDLYILTKEGSRIRQQAYAAKLYKVSREQWQSGAGQVLTMTHVTDVDIPGIVKPRKSREGLVTSMDISPDGKRFLVLTYDAAVEFEMDWSKYKVIPIEPLKQQESVSYLPDGKSFVYTSEYYKNTVPKIMRVDCKE